MTTGVVIGKFYPVHKGHSHLINAALAQVTHVVVLVCEKEEQTISGAQRATWLKELHPQAEVRVIPDILDPDDSEGWAKYTIEQLGYVPDVVFTSEDYGEPYAQFMGCKHVLVDRSRVLFPCSGREIRENPLLRTNWEFMEPCVQQYFLKRICIVGAESTGKTTLAKNLAEMFGTVWVPEYGRFYTDGRIPSLNSLPPAQPLQTGEFTHIAQMQVLAEDQMAKFASRYLICDTDAFATRIWHRRYLNYWSDEVKQIADQHPHDLYLLTTPDFDFVQDGTRDGEHIRHWMHNLFVEKLEEQGIPFEVISGPHLQRLTLAVLAVTRLSPQKRAPSHK